MRQNNAYTLKNIITVLEIRSRGNPTVGSNPTPSANNYKGFMSFPKIEKLEKSGFLLTRF